MLALSAPRPPLSPPSPPPPPPPPLPLRPQGGQPSAPPPSSVNPHCLHTPSNLHSSSWVLCLPLHFFFFFFTASFTLDYLCRYLTVTLLSLYAWCLLACFFFVCLFVFLITRVLVTPVSVTVCDCLWLTLQNIGKPSCCCVSLEDGGVYGTVCVCSYCMFTSRRSIWSRRRIVLWMWWCCRSLLMYACSVQLSVIPKQRPPRRHDVISPVLLERPTHRRPQFQDVTGDPPGNCKYPPVIGLRGEVDLCDIGCYFDFIVLPLNFKKREKFFF